MNKIQQFLAQGKCHENDHKIVRFSTGPGGSLLYYALELQLWGSCIDLNTNFCLRPFAELIDLMFDLSGAIF
jgi:hypothetical protein